MNPISNTPQIPYDFTNQSNITPISTPSDIPQNENDTYGNEYDYSKEFVNIISDPNPRSEILERRTEGDRELIDIVTKMWSFKGYINGNKPLGYGIYKVQKDDNSEAFCLEGEFDDNICLNAKKSFSSDQVHEGNFKFARLTGPGKVTFQNNVTIEGFWLSGVPSGAVKITYTNGTKYLGNYINSMREGFATMTFSNGMAYKGPFVNNIFSGKGTMFDDKGWSYEGPFENNTFANKGTGKITYNKKDIYEGEVSKGKANGKGVLITQQGDRFVGYFKDDKLHGFGTLYLHTGPTNQTPFEMLETQWEKGLPVEKSKGKIKFLNGDYYEGELIYKIRHGHGSLTYNDGFKYEGEFNNDKITGRGKFIHTDGTTLEGHYVDSQLVYSKPGTLTMPNGNFYEGFFAHCPSRDIDVCHGMGKMTFPNGEVREGNFTYGHFDPKSFAKITLSNGITYEGQIRDIGNVKGKGEAFVPHGKGTMTYPDGKIIRGIFANGSPTDKTSVTIPQTQALSQVQLQELEDELCESKKTEKTKKGKEKAPETTLKANKKSKGKDTPKTTTDENTCTICLEKPRQSFFDPCGHKITCHSCGTNCTNCPICRTAIQSQIVMKEIHNEGNCSNCLQAPPPNDPLVALIPCGHFPFCKACVKKGEECPKCQTVIEAVKKIFNA